MSRIRRFSHCGLAAALVLIVNVLTAALSSRYPFGDYTRNINDMWNQFIPFHLHFRDVLRGESSSDFFFNWAAGGGMPFLGDYGTYLSSPWSLLVLLFPREEIELAIWVIVMCKMAFAAFAMAWLLSAVNKGPTWALAPLGAAYGTCGWAIDDASYVPMWLDGLAALPIISIVALWALQRRRFISGTLLIAAMWWSNYYTAYMASIGASAFLVTLVVLRSAPAKTAIRTLARFGSQGILGVGLTAVLLLPTYISVLNSTPGISTSLRAVPWSTFAERLLSATEGVGRSPSLSVGMLPLTLALGLPWLSRLSPRTRITLTSSAMLVLVSFNLNATHQIWHLFTSPNGSQFRQAFIGSFWIIILAWFAISVSWTRKEILAASISLLALSAVAYSGSQAFTTRWTWLAVGMTLVTLMGILVGLKRPTRPTTNTLRTVALTGLLGAVILEATGTYLITQRGQDAFLSLSPDSSAKTTLQSLPESFARQPITDHRQTPLGFRNLNSGMLLGLDGLDYYSSLTPRIASSAAMQLGWPYLAGGRSFESAADSVSWAIMSVGSIVGNSKEYPQPSLPLVRLLDARPELGDDIWENREALLGHPVYTPATTQVSVSGAAFQPLQLPRTFGGDLEVTLRIQCSESDESPHFLVTTEGSVWVSDIAGSTARTLTGEAVFQGSQNRSGDYELRGRGDFTLPASAVMCMSRNSLVQATNIPTAKTIHVEGSSIRAAFDEPATGVISIATFTHSGWQCHIDGIPVEQLRGTGLLTVEGNGASELLCQFRPRGVTHGLYGTLLALAVLGLTGAIGWVRRHQRDAAALPQPQTETGPSQSRVDQTSESVAFEE